MRNKMLRQHKFLFFTNQNHTREELQHIEAKGLTQSRRVKIFSFDLCLISQLQPLISLSLSHESCHRLCGLHLGSSPHPILLMFQVLGQKCIHYERETYDHMPYVSWSHTCTLKCLGSNHYMVARRFIFLKGMCTVSQLYCYIASYRLMDFHCL